MAVSAPWRDPKTGIWKLRKRVPARYAAVERKTTIKITTGTADRKQALKHWPAILRQWAAMEAQWERALVTGQTVIPASPRTLTFRETRAIAGLWYKESVALWEDDPGIWQDWDDRRERLQDQAYKSEDHSEVGYRIDYYPDKRALSEARAELLCRDIIADEPSVRALAVALWEHKRHHAALMMRRAQGDYGADPLLETIPALPEPVAAPAVTLTFTNILDSWNAVTTVKPRTKAETGYALGQLERFLGHADARQVTTSELRRWRDDSVANGRNNNTWNGQLSMVGQVFLQATKDGLLSSNPADKSLRLRAMRNESPLPYDDAQATQILIASRLETRASIRWAHWIMAFTGMRVAEVMQLSVADLRVDDGLHYFAIHEDSPDKSVKTAERRNVPMHSALIREGLLKYAASLPKDGALFPDKRPDGFGLQGGRAYNVVGRWVREVVKLTDPRLAPNHSWRHRVEDELRGQEVPEDVRDAITGHARKTTGRNYGVRKEALRRLAEAIEKLPVPDGLMVKN
jgi:site-specific recombinase XerD